MPILFYKWILKLILFPSYFQKCHELAEGPDNAVDPPVPVEFHSAAASL